MIEAILYIDRNWNEEEKIEIGRLKITRRMKTFDKLSKNYIIYIRIKLFFKSFLKISHWQWQTFFFFFTKSVLNTSKNQWTIDGLEFETSELRGSRQSAILPGIPPDRPV